MLNFNLDQLKAFRSVVEAGTLEAAARELYVTPSAISQRLKALEASVGRVLLQRTKPVVPTESGEAILLLARQVEELTNETRLRLDNEQLTAITLALNADSLATWALPALATLSDVATFEIFREDETRTTSLLREGKVMAAVTSVAEPVQGCKSCLLGKMRYRPVATASFVKKWFSDGVNAASLAVAPHIAFDRNDSLQANYLRRHVRKPVSPPCNYVPATIEYSSAIIAGMGWGLIPEAQKLSGRALVELEPGVTVDVKLYWQQWRLSSARLDAVGAAIKQAAQAALA